MILTDEVGLPFGLNTPDHSKGDVLDSHLLSDGIGLREELLDERLTE